MNKEYLEALDWLEEKCYVENPQAEKFEECCKIIRQFLHRLEAIDNAEPSEALECLEFICKILNEKRIDVKWLFKNDYTTIKQALLKAQEPKKYLKWEDLEFKEKEQTRMEVLLNGSRYLLEYYAVSEKEFVFIRARATKTIIFNLLGRCSTDKQFFNDLHLERVEE